VVQCVHKQGEGRIMADWYREVSPKSMCYCCALQAEESRFLREFSSLGVRTRALDTPIPGCES